MTTKYGGYTAAELREFIAASEQIGRSFDYFASADNSTSANVIRDLLDALATPQKVAESAQDVAVPVGITGTMPGTDGFTMACFEASKVPVGTNLYTGSQAPADAARPEPVDEDEDIQPTPESERAAFNAMMRWHLIRLLQAWRYGGDLHATGMAAFEWARTNGVGKDAFKASERAVKLAAPTQQPARASEAGEAVTGDARECLLDVVSHHDNIVAGFAAQRLAAEEANDHDTALYWKREISVAHRMREQAERALAAPAQQAVALTDAARDMLAERRRQVEQEGWTADDDDRRDTCALARAGASYAMSAGGVMAADYSPPAIWPWTREWWKPTTPRRDLIKAGALILAEIERIDRAALQLHSKGEAS